MTNQLDFIVTFYFVSGEKMEARYSEHEKDNLVSFLQKSWEDGKNVGNDYGINYRHVTHYMVKKV